MCTPGAPSVAPVRAEFRFRRRLKGNPDPMVGILVAAVLAALTFAVCTALGLPIVVGIVFALIVLVASVPALGSRFGFRDF